MAKGKKTGGRDFVKGVAPNPAGRPPMPEYLRKAKRMNKIRFQEILQKYIHSTTGELKKALKDPETPVIELCVIKVLHESILRGDQKRLEFILDRLIGKVKNEVDITTDGESLNADINLKKLSDEELERLEKIVEKCKT